MTASNDYKVQLDVFEGPLDLLLYLAKKEEVEITDIPIERITRQYMEYLDVMRMLDLNIAGEFIVMAATLILIKSRMLLPEDQRPAELEGEEEDPRWDLIRQLVEYKKFKDAALQLEQYESLQEHVFTRRPDGSPAGPDASVALQDVSLFDLIAAFQEALKKVPQESLKEIFAERFTVAEKIDLLMATLAEHSQVTFGELFSGLTSRHEIVCTFLALLELIRLQQIHALQEGAFGKIIIARTSA